MEHANPSEPAVVYHSRRVEHLGRGQLINANAALKITRLLTHELQGRLDPFLLLDNFHTEHAGDYVGGFPERPQRGFESITYMVSGRLRHRDNAGHEGVLEAGGVQWLVAGAGIRHAEMPEQDRGEMEGFQLWLNLPAEDKMCASWYRDIAAGDIPELQTPEHVSVRVIAGHTHGIAGAMQRPQTLPLCLDIALGADMQFAQPLPPTHNAFLHVYKGELSVGDTDIPERHLAVLDNDPTCDGVVMYSRTPARVLLVAGKPLHEPIAQYGPFVMNSQAQIRQAMSDYRDGRL